MEYIYIYIYKVVTLAEGVLRRTTTVLQRYHTNTKHHQV
jgi:hypothetical protein